MTEIRFAPDDKATLQVMFSSMSHCQTLHPDPEAAEDAADEEAENDEVRYPAMFCFWVSVLFIGRDLTRLTPVQISLLVTRASSNSSTNLTLLLMRRT